MAAGKNDLIIRLILEDGEFKGKIKSAESTGKNFGNELSKSNKKAALSFTEINQGAELIKKGFGLAQGAARALFDALDKAQKIEGVTRGFDNLQKAAGLDTKNSLDELRVSTQGLISDFDLMQQANQAVQLGLDPTQLDEMAAAAIKLGAAVGRTGQEAFGDLITGVGRASPLILDNLGITVKAADAYERYAEKLNVTVDALTEQQKAEAFRVVALEKIAQKAAELSDIEDTAATQATKLTVAIDNQKNKLLEGLSASDGLEQSLSDLTTTINNIDTDKLVEGIESFIDVTTTAISALIDFRKNFVAITDTQAGATEFFEEQARAQLEAAETGDELQAALKNVSQQVENAKKKLEEAKPSIFEITAAQFGFSASLADSKRELETLQGAIEGNQKALRKYGSEQITAALDFVKKGIQRVKGEFIRAAVEQEKADAASKQAQKEAAKEYADAVTSALEKLQGKYNDLNQKIRENDIAGSIQAAVDAGNNAQLDGLRRELKDSIFQGYVDGIGEAASSPQVQAEIEKIAVIEADEQFRKQIEAADKINDERLQKDKELYQKSADFFTDFFLNAINGVTFDFEDALKRVAAGFAGGLAASLTGAFSPENASAQGLGQSLAKSLFGSGFQGVATEQLGGLFGGGANIGPVADGGAYAASLSGAGGLAAIGAGGAIAAGVGLAIKGVESSIERIKEEGLNNETARLIASNPVITGLNELLGTPIDPDHLSRIAYLTPGIGPALMAADTLGVDFNFGSKKSVEQQMRDGIRDAFRETALGDSLSFSGVRGPIQFAQGVDPILNSDLAGQIKPFVSGIANAFGDAPGVDFANILANAVSEADNFNEALLNTRSLLLEVGYSADELKEPLKQAFLEGTIGLGEFGEQLSALNQLQNANIEGVGNINGALELLSQSFGDPKLELLAFQTILAEFAEVGVTSFSEIGAALAERLGPDARRVFEQLERAGITSFDNIGDLSADQIYAIIANLDQIKGAITSTFSGATVEAARSAEDALDRVEKKARSVADSFERMSKQAQNANKNITDLNRNQTRGTGGANDNPVLGPTP